MAVIRWTSCIEGGHRVSFGQKSSLVVEVEYSTGVREAIECVCDAAVFLVWVEATDGGGYMRLQGGDDPVVRGR